MKWHCRFRDHRFERRSLPAFNDHAASLAFGRKIRKLCDLRAAGESPQGDLAQWVNGLTDEVRDKLIGWGILDLKSSMATRPLTDHIEDWYESTLAKGRTKEHAELFKVRVAKIFAGCNFARFADIDELAVQHWVARNTGSAQTRNHYCAALRAFCRWMVRHGRAVSSPIRTLEMMNVDTDRKRVRRALTIEQLQKLIQTAEDGPTRGRTSGHERALIYWTAAESGYRASELRSLRTSDFALSGTTPTVRVRAAVKGNKAKREAILELSADLAAQLRVHLANKLPSASAFNVPFRTSLMIQFDLARARIPYRDPETDEYIDFHALRTTCATNLARGGVHPAVMQKRLRHCTMELTMGVYTKLNLDDQAEAVKAMPKMTIAG